MTKMTMDYMSIFLNFICPSLGVILSWCMFGAPIFDLRRALLIGKGLGKLNPFPWVMQTGNCLGWIVYAYYTGRDPFLVAANVPGLIISLWLNSGASKLQYLERLQQGKHQPASQEDRKGVVVGADDNYLVTVPQERAMIQILCAWVVVISFVTWGMEDDPTAAAATVGIVVNANLIFFYAAPLQTLRSTVRTRNSASIHRPTMYMNWCSTSFWVLYGVAKKDLVIIIPNAIGLSLGLTQGVLCACYPSIVVATLLDDLREFNRA
jgi:solute carrier family 50 protein (sugar transporter)